MALAEGEEGRLKGKVSLDTLDVLFRVLVRVRVPLRRHAKVGLEKKKALNTGVGRIWMF